MKAGDYVRTKHYGIFKILKVRKENYQTICLKKKGYEVVIGDKNNSVEDEIIKSSPNIIDLIEVGDYVNGFKVIDILENDIYVSDYYAESYIGVVKVKDIKSIVTKEQFESMEYKVKE